MQESVPGGVPSRTRAKKKEILTTVALAAIISLAAYACYSNCFSAPFVFDDIGSIPINPTIRRLWPLGATLSPPPGALTVSGRPILNLSFAINYAMTGLTVRSYHAANLILHILAAMTLFGIARRTLEGPKIAYTPGTARSIAFAIALIWALHPLQTESVTYIVQRAESLMGLFFLLTLYCFVRGAEDNAEGAKSDLSEGRAFAWLGLSWLACLLGMATKEVMVTAPVIVLLYDRTFLAGSFSKALRTRMRFYSGLFATWLALPWLVASTHGRGGTAGSTLGWEASVTYAQSQFAAIVHYLRLAVWPSPLVFDYGTDWSHSGEHWILPACAVAILLAGSLYCLWRWPSVGFLGITFFIILAPSSSIVPIGTERMAEHRMYLPLAAVVAAVVCAIHCITRRIWASGLRLVGWAVLIVASLGLGALTFARNSDYGSELSIWRDTVAKSPNNFTAHNNLALALEAAGDTQTALAEYGASIRLEPDDPKVRNNFGRLLSRTAKMSEAADQFREALRVDPDNPEAHNNLGVTLAVAGRLDEALDQFQHAVKTKPDYAEAHYNLGLALNKLGRSSEAGQEFEAARRFKSLLAVTANRPRSG